MKKCLYCGCQLPEDRVVDCCDRCGKKVWGDRMFSAILENMNQARDNGDLCLNDPSRT